MKSISYEKDATKCSFYLELAINQQWNTLTLIEQIDKMLFERAAIAQKPEEQINETLTGLKSSEVINPD